MKDLKYNLYFKLGTIFFLILILLFPSFLVQNLIDERESIQKEAIEEVSGKWAKGQTITGPFVSIPYDKYIKRYDQKTKTDQIIKEKEWIHILPNNLKINGKIEPEKRYRGIYEVVVYDSKLKIQGDYKSFQFTNIEVDENNIHYDKAVLNLGISDLKGIENQVLLNWGNDKFSFNSGIDHSDVTDSGINATIHVEKNSEKSYSFSMDLDLKGSQHIYFIPVGKVTDVSLGSVWQTPSFTGNYLPDDRQEDNGFKAHWNILHLNRNYPQAWIGNQYNVSESSFGTDLLLPVDSYKKANRVAKYAILFLVLTFMVFFFVEILNKIFIHPIQYILVGFALLIFYILMLSISEHLTFNLAYILATFATLLLIFGYTKAILKSNKISILIIGILLILYLFIFTIIQLEDYALLIGSIGLFIILALVMYYSRKIDWYNINLRKDENEA